jgi:outer membrane protein OmpA-like peptidoglycan-associated protein
MLAAKITNSEVARPQTAPATRHASKIVSPLTAFPFSIQRKSSCACGGGCENCEQKSDQPHIQTKLAISAPGDQFEQEADRVADQIVQTKSAPCACGGGCAGCQKKREPLVQRKLGAGAGMGQSTASDFTSRLGAGQALDPASRAFFEPRLGQELGGVRVHTGAAADAAASSVSARAFTLGRDLVFAAGEYSPATNEGRRLLAHELVHWVQQGGRSDRIQRSLKVDTTASDDKTTAISQMTPLLNKLCPDFDVNAKSGDVTAKTKTDCAGGDFGKIAAGSQKLGCCCLCTLVRAPAPWRILVTITDAPTTNPSAHTVRMIPTAGPSAPDLRSWTAGPTEKMTALPSEEALGHELCGHAALSQAGAHPADETDKTRRTFSDIHDPTVKIENELAGSKEMALGTAPRGLAGGGAHRGESLRVFVVKTFAADSAKIDAPLQAIIDGAAKFADGNEGKLIDVVGFSDSSDTVAGISKSRADAVRTALDGKMTRKDDAEIPLSPGAKPTSIPRLQPATDGGAGSLAAVEIRLAREPAGLVKLPAGVTLPAKVTHVDAKTPAVVDLVVKKGKSTGNACHDLLITSAWK